MTPLTYIARLPPYSSLDGQKGHVPNQGTFETVVNVTGENVTVRGFVDNGVVKISTAFIT